MPWDFDTDAKALSWGYVDPNWTDLPYCSEEGIKITPQFIGTARRSLSGALTVDKVVEKRKIEIQWKALDIDERSTLRGVYDSKHASAEVLRLPDNQQFTVVAASFGWEEEQYWGADGTVPYYHVKITFLEV